MANVTNRVLYGRLIDLVTARLFSSTYPTPSEVSNGQNYVRIDDSGDLSFDSSGASGFEQVARFDQLVDWQRGCDAFLESAGPRFAWLEVGPTPGGALSNPVKLAPIDQRIANLQQALESTL